MSLFDGNEAGSLLDAFRDAEGCVILQKTRIPDGQGGYVQAWKEGAVFYPSWEYMSAPEMTVAEQQGVSRVYRLYVDQALDLEHHEVFRRLKTGQVYRVTNPGTDRYTPHGSLINQRLIEAEQWELPHE